MKQHLRKNAVLVGIAAVFTAPTANADKGFSVGIASVQTSADLSNIGFDSSADASGQRLFATYMFNDNFGVEAGTTDYGRPSDPNLPSDQEIERESQDIYAVGNYSVSEKFSLFGKAGIVESKNSSEFEEQNLASATTTDLSLAFGGEYDLFKRFALRGEYQWLDGQGSSASNIWSVSAIFRFR